MSKAKLPPRWACGNCGRSVPGDVAECHCGTSRRMSEAALVQQKRSQGGASVSLPDLLGQLAVLGAVFYLGLAWRQGVPPAPPPPVDRPLVPARDPTPPASSRGRPAMAQVPFEPSPHAADPSNADEPEEQTSPPSTPSPEPPS